MTELDMNRPTLKILKIRENAQIPAYATDGAAGMDLSAAIDEPITLEPLDRKLIPTGLIIELPKGYEAQVRPRSGLSIKHGMTLINCIGTIDEDYRGEVCVPMVNISKETYTIQPNDRIAQMIISPVNQVEIIKTEMLSETQRASGGFGSTGY
ncbi:MAG: dUTP diphosphatase [Candidatus Gastranaerophilales bacterium]|nr:dUTP diphosphatase [Candidatus Gastranaerophilales bacterium]